MLLCMSVVYEALFELSKERALVQINPFLLVRNFVRNFVLPESKFPIS